VSGPLWRHNPGVAQLPDLVEHARTAGLPVTRVVDGEPAPVPPGLDIAAYRIVQEGLTNAAKHATGANVTATIHYAENALDIEVVDDGPSSPGPSLVSGGHGLIGMRERVTVLGGTVKAEPRPGGGFRLRASLPMATK
jgi:signal transduction histidine kinase